jgi:hypothetical protein
MQYAESRSVTSPAASPAAGIITVSRVDRAQRVPPIDWQGSGEAGGNLAVKVMKWMAFDDPNRLRLSRNKYR